MTKDELNLHSAEQQFLGYQHASEGYSAVRLAMDMGLLKHEWEKLKEAVFLSESDKNEIDAYFANGRLYAIPSS